MDAQWLVLALTFGLVLFTGFACAINYFLLRTHLDPEVIVYTKHDVNRPSLVLLVIKNIGRGVAYDVRFRLSRPIPEFAQGVEATGRERSFDQMKTGPLIEGIPLLAPDETRVITWGQYGGLADALGGIPARVTARYRSKGALHPWDPTDHSRESLLEVRSFSGTDGAASPAARTAKSLENMEKHMHFIRKGVAKLTAPPAPKINPLTGLPITTREETPAGDR